MVAHVIPYPYSRFEREVMRGDDRFAPESPASGDVLPPFNLITTDGFWVDRQDFAGRKLLISFGSIT